MSFCSITAVRWPAAAIVHARYFPRFPAAEDENVVAVDLGHVYTSLTRRRVKVTHAVDPHSRHLCASAGRTQGSLENHARVVWLGTQPS